jgi:hypothetical protein
MSEPMRPTPTRFAPALPAQLTLVGLAQGRILVRESKLNPDLLPILRQGDDVYTAICPQTPKVRASFGGVGVGQAGLGWAVTGSAEPSHPSASHPVPFSGGGGVCGSHLTN